MASAKAFLGAIAGRFLFRPGRVSALERPSEHFVRFVLEGDGLRGASFTPGDKVQVFLSGEGMRTYTPITWSAEGRAEFLGFIHGSGPGSSWLSKLAMGDGVQLFGPRRSIDAGALAGPLVVVGDETSIAVAVALTRARAGRHVTALLESSFADETKQRSAAEGLTSVTVTPRGELAPSLVAQVELGAIPIFTGRAATIQELKRELRSRSLNASGPSKAYWAEGKRGLD